MYDTVMNAWEYRYKNSPVNGLFVSEPGREPYYRAAGLFNDSVIHYYPDTPDNRSGTLWARKPLIPEGE